jgi:hypothetical protein
MSLRGGDPEFLSLAAQNLVPGDREGAPRPPLVQGRRVSGWRLSLSPRLGDADQRLGAEGGQRHTGRVTPA